jgi:hypothetical protein
MSDWEDFELDEFLEHLNGRCVSCKHWDGDPKKELAAVNHSESFSRYNLENGYADEGCCDKAPSHSGLIEIETYGGWDGHGVDTVKYSAHFGCVLWEKS